MSLDFFIEDMNTAIEVQGEQHFRPVKYWGGEEIFEQVVKRDNKKRELCEKHGVKLLYYSELKRVFPYYVITDEEILLEKILENKK